MMDQEIKEEPPADEERSVEILDHDCRLLKPKFEEIATFFELKIEEPEYFYTEQSDVKLEPVEVVKQELLEPKLEEPDYIEMDCSFKYPDYLNSTQKSSPEPEEPEISGPCSSHSLIIIKHKRNPPIYKCQVCNSFESNDKISHLCSYEKRLILLVGMICAGKNTKKEAQHLITRPKITICKIHFSEAVDEIYTALNIKNIQEINSCSEGNKQKLMHFVNFLCKYDTFDHFIKILSVSLEKALRSRLKRNMSSSSTATLKKPKRTSNNQLGGVKCSVCSVVKSKGELKTIESRGRQLVLMVGCVLNGKKTVEEAQSLFMKYRIFICRSHLSETVDEIFKTVNIKKIDEMMRCSMENREMLMTTVKLLYPQMCFLQFSEIFRSFCLKFSS